MPHEHRHGDNANSHTPEHDADHVHERAQLLQEEQAVGSAQPEAQAEAILAESDERAEQAERDQREGPEPIERRKPGEAS